MKFQLGDPIRLFHFLTSVLLLAVYMSWDMRQSCEVAHVCLIFICLFHVGRIKICNCVPLTLIFIILYDMISYDFILRTGRTKAKDYIFCHLNFLQLWQNKSDTFIIIYLCVFFMSCCLAPFQLLCPGTGLLQWCSCWL